MQQLFLLRSLLVSMSLVMAPVFAQPQPQVNVVAVQSKAVGSGFEMDGVVQPVKQGTVSAQASGRLVTLAVKAGAQVRAGQLLATIDDRETQTGVQRSRAQVAQAQAEALKSSRWVGKDFAQDARAMHYGDAEPAPIHGQASPEGFWYDQSWDEWVLLLKGSAELDLNGLIATLTPGDHLLIPAGLRHRVCKTDSDQPTIWLAIHIDTTTKA